MNRLKKLPDWKQHLTQCINEHKEQPFAYGTHDCFQWVCSCIKAMTGIDFGEKSVGTYTDEIGAYKALKKIGNAENMKELFASKFEQIHIASALPGDIVYKESNYHGFNIIAGICYGATSYFIEDGQEGLIGLPTLSLDGAFRI